LDTFLAGMDNAQQTQLDAKLFNEIWSSSDLNPNLIRKDLNKIFTLNKTATEYANSADIFFNYNQEEARASDSQGGSSQTTHDIVSQKSIQNFLRQQNIEAQWSGEKWEPKAFSVYKLTDITDCMEIALVAKQLIAGKSNAAETKLFNVMDVPVPGKAGYSVLSSSQVKFD
jgi:hypothetical protein